ncbi:hypothetical protein J6590_058777 [Homalodisca vitripennis]|nr:hypothetical protein J6590_058777 [Homalodisca vitripennis]
MGYKHCMILRRFTIKLNEDKTSLQCLGINNDPGRRQERLIKAMVLFQQTNKRPGLITVCRQVSLAARTSVVHIPSCSDPSSDHGIRTGKAVVPVQLRNSPTIPPPQHYTRLEQDRYNTAKVQLMCTEIFILVEPLNPTTYHADAGGFTDVRTRRAIEVISRHKYPVGILFRTYYPLAEHRFSAGLHRYECGPPDYTCRCRGIAYTGTRAARFCFLTICNSHSALSIRLACSTPFDSGVFRITTGSVYRRSDELISPVTHIPCTSVAGMPDFEPLLASSKSCERTSYSR